jgi:hypothetical protein
MKRSILVKLFLFISFYGNAMHECLPIMDQVYATVIRPCHGHNNGSIDVKIYEDNGPYDIKWYKKEQNGDLTLLESNTNVFYGLDIEDLNEVDEGLYVLSITNNVCGHLEIEVEVKAYDAIEIPDPTINTNCVDKGSIIFNKKPFSGGEPPYTFKWSNGQTSATLQTQTSGMYAITVTDARSCKSSRTFNFQINQLNVIPYVVQTECDGSTIDLGLNPEDYIITWSMDNRPETSAEVLYDDKSLLAELDGAHKYHYFVKTNNGLCKTSGTIDLYLASIPIHFGNPKIFSSCTGPNGSINLLNCKGGESPLTFAWSNGRFGEKISNLLPGTYTVTVTDAIGCSKSKSFVTSPGGGIWYSQVLIYNTCFGTSNGQISFLGLEPATTFVWDHGPTTDELIDLPAGTYCCTMYLDACTTRACFTIEEFPNVPIVINETVYSTCSGPKGTGIINLTVTGGFLPSIAWQDDQLARLNRINLKAGFYTVIVNDICNRIEKSIEVKTMPYSVINISGKAHSGIEGGTLATSTGYIEALTTGGTGLFLYRWQKYKNYYWENVPYESNKNIYNVSSGRYKLIVTDKNSGCETERIFILTNHTCSSEKLSFAAFTTNQGSSNNTRCDGPPRGIKFEHFIIKSGEVINAPVTISIKGDNFSFSKTLNAEELKSLNEDPFDNIIVENLPRTTYKITAIDACGRVGEKYIHLCTPCSSITYSEEEGKNNHFINFDDTFFGLKVQCACTNDNCTFWSKIGGIFGSVHRTLIEPSGNNFPKGIRYTITWPDNSHCTVKEDGNGNGGFDVEGDSYYVIPDEEINTVVTVKVARDDGCSEIDIPIHVGGTVESVLFMSRQNDFGTIFDAEYYGGVAKIQRCRSSSIAPTYETTSKAVDKDIQREYFIFKPSRPDAQNPCKYGGTFSTFEIVNGAVVFTEAKSIPPNVSIGGKKDNYYGNSAVLPDECERGGYCLFNAIDLYNIKLDKHLIMTWCASSSPFPPDVNPNVEPDPVTGADPDPPIEEYGVNCPNDMDCDGIKDDVDNCPKHGNKDQKNSDNDKIGDACDNCRKITNQNQLNSDPDKHGDACDNCDFDANEDQADKDQDGIGDVCDDTNDTDIDGIDDLVDNCPKDFNTNQLNSDQDSYGDACDNCDFNANEDQADTDKDGIGDLCDECPAIPNKIGENCKCPNLTPPNDYNVISVATFYLRLPRAMPFSLEYTYTSNQYIVVDDFPAQGGIIKLNYKKHSQGGYGLVKVKLICNYPPGCPVNEINFNLKMPQFHDPDNPNNNVNCDDPVDITFNHTTHEFVYFSNNHRTNSYNILGEVIDSTNYSILKEITRQTITTDVKFIRFDMDGNYVIFSIKSDSTLVTIMTPSKVILHTQWYSSIEVINVPGYTITYPLNFVGYNMYNHNYYYIQSTNNFTNYTSRMIPTSICNQPRNTCPGIGFPKENEVVYYSIVADSTHITFVNNLLTYNVNILGQLKIAKINYLSTDEYLIAGSFKQNLIINGVTYVTVVPGKQTSILIWLNRLKEVTNVEVIDLPFNHVINTITDNGKGTYMFTVIVRDTVFIDSIETVIDSCGFIYGLKSGSTIDSRVSESVETKNETEQIKIYPNPFSNGFTIEFNSPEFQYKTIEIFNSFGQPIYIDRNIPFLEGNNLYYIKENQKWPPGIYTIKCNGQGEPSVNKIIKID